MKKYKYLYKDYLIRICFFCIFFLVLLFLQVGFKNENISLIEMYKMKVKDPFTFIQFAIPLFLVDNFRLRKEEILRNNKHFLLIASERIVLNLIIIIFIRMIAFMIYEVYIYHSLSSFILIIRFILIDFGSILFCYICANIFLNKYVGMIISFFISFILYDFKITYYDIIKLNNQEFNQIGIVYLFSVIGVFFVLYISLLWRNEYVSD